MKNNHKGKEELFCFFSNLTPTAEKKLDSRMSLLSRNVKSENVSVFFSRFVEC